MFIVAGLVLGEFLGFGAWRTFRIAATQCLDNTAGKFSWIKARTKSGLEALWRPILESEDQRRSAQEAEHDRPYATALGKQADRWLKTIKFQQSYTSGWSGALKLPVGLEGGVTRAVTLAQNQLSLPEIVHFLTAFIDALSEKYRVIIGIDEMDKLATEDLAQQFLNDIKSIFGLERCFYLVAVSEDAMSHFERRGLKFRDVFDSAFDDFIYVDHLDFESARDLLEQRVVGRPVPFFALSYCMSGGLPRDLIRNFRSVLEIHEHRGNPVDDLSDICRELVRADLLAKIRAIRLSARKFDMTPELDEFLESLYQMEEGVNSDIDLVDNARKLLNATPVQRGAEVDNVANSSSLSPSENVEHASNVTALRGLADELGTYACYAITLRQFFSLELTETILMAPAPGGSVEALSRARRMLGHNPAITRTLLRGFRNAHGLSTLL